MGKIDTGNDIRDRLRLRIFISSPADVAASRESPVRCSGDWPTSRTSLSRIDLEEVSYDDPDAPASMDAHLTFQSAINKSKPRPSACDVVMVILWSRLGSKSTIRLTSNRTGVGVITPAPRVGVHGRLPGGESTARDLGWVFRRRRPIFPLSPDDPENVIADKRDQGTGLRRSSECGSQPLLVARRPWVFLLMPSPRPTKISSSISCLPPNCATLIWSRLQAAGLGAPGSSPAISRHSGLLNLVVRFAHWTVPALCPSFLRTRGRNWQRWIQDVANKPFVAVLGRSGSGKSSLVYAGLLPSLAEGNVPRQCRLVGGQFQARGIVGRTN